jgi:hypothetical protein
MQPACQLMQLLGARNPSQINELKAPETKNPKVKCYDTSKCGHRADMEAHRIQFESRARPDLRVRCLSGPSMGATGG